MAKKNPTKERSTGRGTDEDHVKVSFVSGGPGGGFFHREGAPLECAIDSRHKIHPGHYHSQDAEGRPVCRECRPFDVLSAG
jgi:hypothetical protein